MTTIVLWADTFEQTTDFYRRVLGASLKHASDEFVSIVARGNEVLLHRVPQQWATVIANPPKIREENPIKPCFEVDSIEDARLAVLGSNGWVLAAETEQAHGDKTYCDAVDPEGNVIQLFSRTRN